MPRQFDADAVRRIGDAIRELESRSSAELVVEVRARSGSYAHAEGRFAAVAVLFSLAVLVFMPLGVPAWTVLLDVIAVYPIAVVFARRSDAVRRLFTTRRERLQAVRTYAAALFHDRGVANTSGETGVLLLASLLERRIEVLADRGLLRLVVANDWNAALGELHDELPINEERLVAAIHRLGGILERDVPAGAADVDELSSVPEIDFS
jgi:putative membrane protein